MSTRVWPGSWKSEAQHAVHGGRRHPVEIAYMARLTCSIALIALCLFELDPGTRTATAAAATDAHAYFDALVARSDHWKSYSLRSAAQLAYPNQGGYASNNRGKLWVTYDPGADTDPHAQDAAKVVVPAFLESGGTLSASVDASTTTISLAADSGGQPPHSIKVDSEIMTIRANAGGVLTVTRGQFGTTAAPHTANATARLNVNSVPSYVILPLATTDGHAYLFTWDGYWTDSYVRSGLINHKAFQFTSGGNRVWFELQTNLNGGPASIRPPGWNASTDVAAVSLRSYYPMGPGVG